MTQTGKSIYELDTPTLLLDQGKLEANIRDMANFAKENGLMLRPHIKTHKSSKIAKMQLEAGAVGITTAKIGEAEVMARAGIKDILIAYPIAAEKKVNRLIELLGQEVHLKVAVDNLEQLGLLDQFMSKTPHQLEVWIKVNSGLNRCGVEPGSEAVQLAKNIALKKKLKLGGIFTHAGHSYAAPSLAEIEKIGLLEGKAVAESAEACEREGIPIAVRSVGSTPTYKIAGKVKGINEVRPGNAVFFDAIQAGLGVTEIDRCALTVLAAVAGKYPNRKTIVLDTGSKVLCLDQGAHGNKSVKGFGHVVGHSEITIERLSEEHGIASIEGETSLCLNDVVQIIPNHACPVVNLFDEYVIHQEGVVTDVWDIEARGKVT
ncbi:D-serine deaminase-like pyridoxal phosphate-dependent protein [Bacillus oleivorans]|uniref:D-serine deaminase-like pyridoxal phosphate-dependent protein n=1 Tax=Bacillus oleivorans TaxID=1448271 RepID=A0A285CS19_9BACI|nr:alanine racemase [Bacillus oleivorans]SNX70332.1 D-serine deaminase-like pyridoxal phosphate-dependent protein [Bacillus oleivorans]